MRSPIGALWLGLGLGAGCRITPRQPAADGPFFDGEPAVVALAVACDPDAARWRLAAETDAWTGGGALFVTDGERVERHTVSSSEAAGDGAWDCLDLNLAQAADPDDAASGGATRWLCRDTPDLSFLFVVSNTDGTEFTDCVAWGASPSDWADLPEVPACDAVSSIDDEGVVMAGFEACD